EGRARCDPHRRYAGQPRPRVASANREDGVGYSFRSGRFPGRDRAGCRRMDGDVGLTATRGHDGVAPYRWLGGLDPIPDFNPMLQMASGVYLTFFGSFVFGTPGFPLSNVPLQNPQMPRPAGSMSSQPGSSASRRSREAHRVMEAGEARG